MNTKITEDNILSRNDIAVRYVFQKMFSPQGTLVAVECLSRFDNLTVSPEYFFRHATAAVRERIFLEQLALIEKHKEWFLHNNISATINVDDHILNLLRQKEIKDKIAALTCVHFEVLRIFSIIPWPPGKTRKIPRCGSMTSAQAMRGLTPSEGIILTMSKLIKIFSGI